jgi:MFS transporter, DHA1 family, multidrug resistance protein
MGTHMKSWKRSFVVLWIAEFLAILGFNTSGPIVPLFLVELGIKDPARLNWWTGAINAFPSIALALAAPIWGSLADVYGRKLMLLRAMIGGTILVGVLAATNAPWQVLLLKTLQGCVTGTVAAATVLTASIVPREEVGYRLGLLQVAVYLGNSIGPMFGGVVTDVFGCRLNFVFTSVCLGCAAFIVYRWVHEEWKPVPRSGSILRDAMPDFRVLAASPTLAAVFVVFFAINLASSVAGPILPLVVLDMLKGQPGAGSLSGLIIGASSVAAAISAALIGRVSARLGYGKTLAFCVAGACAFAIPQGFAVTPYQLLALRIGVGAFIGGSVPSINALIAVLCEKGKQGATYGLSASVQSAGLAVGPAIGALVATELGYPAVFFVSAALIAVTGIAAVPRVARERSGGGAEDSRIAAVSGGGNDQ